MESKQHDCITLDYLELFCQKNQLVIGCRSNEEELWISPLGPHPSNLTAREVQQILRETPLFELRQMSREEEDAGIATPVVLTRSELQLRLKRLLN